jgi:hypothetical protein
MPRFAVPALGALLVSKNEVSDARASPDRRLKPGYCNGRRSAWQSYDGARDRVPGSEAAEHPDRPFPAHYGRFDNLASLHYRDQGDHAAKWEIDLLDRGLLLLQHHALHQRDGRERHEQSYIGWAERVQKTVCGQSQTIYLNGISPVGLPFSGGSATYLSSTGAWAEPLPMIVSS